MYKSYRETISGTDKPEKNEKTKNPDDLAKDIEKLIKDRKYDELETLLILPMTHQLTKATEVKYSRNDPVMHAVRSFQPRMAYLLIGCGFSYDITYKEMMFQPCWTCKDCAFGDHESCSSGKDALTEINVMYFAKESSALLDLANFIKDMKSGKKKSLDGLSIAKAKK